MIVCKQCGSRLEDNAKSCPVCGNIIDISSPDQKNMLRHYQRSGELRPGFGTSAKPLIFGIVGLFISASSMLNTVPVLLFLLISKNIDIFPDVFIDFGVFNINGFAPFLVMAVLDGICGVVICVLSVRFAKKEAARLGYMPRKSSVGKVLATIGLVIGFVSVAASAMMFVLAG